MYIFGTHLHCMTKHLDFGTNGDLCPKLCQNHRNWAEQRSHRLISGFCGGITHQVMWLILTKCFTPNRFGPFLHDSIQEERPELEKKWCSELLDGFEWQTSLRSNTYTFSKFGLGTRYLHLDYREYQPWPRIPLPTRHTRSSNGCTTGLWPTATPERVKKKLARQTAGCKGWAYLSIFFAAQGLWLFSWVTRWDVSYTGYRSINFSNTTYTNL